MYLCSKDTILLLLLFILFFFWNVLMKFFLFYVEQAIAAFINTVWMDTKVIWKLEKDR